MKVSNIYLTQSYSPSMAAPGIGALIPQTDVISFKQFAEEIKGKEFISAIKFPAIANGISKLSGVQVESVFNTNLSLQPGDVIYYFASSGEAIKDAKVNPVWPKNNILTVFRIKMYDSSTVAFLDEITLD